MKGSGKMRALWFVPGLLLVFALLGACSSNPPSGGSGSDTAQAKDGVYTASAWGRNGEVIVTTTISGGAIADVTVGSHIETSVFTNRAIPVLAAAIVEHNSYGVDVVAGATFTSRAIKQGVEDAISQAGGGKDRYGPRPERPRGPDETVTADVAVVGAGISGIMAALNAADAGAKVVLLEKTSIVGGCSLQSFGTFQYGMASEIAAGEKTQELILQKFNNWIRTEMYRVDASLLNTYLQNAGGALDYLKAEGFFGPGVVEFMGNKGMFLMPYDDRQPLLEKLLDERVIARGGAVYRETTGKSLITRDGTVTGVSAQRRDGSTLTVNAKAVVIATGGYGGDAQMVYETSGVRAAVGSLGSTIGEGIKMAWEVGAKVPANLGGLQLHQTLDTARLRGFDYFHMRMPLILGYVPSLLNVSKSGVRFRNEVWNNNAVAASNAAAFTGDITYVLLSQSMIDKLEQGGLRAIGTDISLSIPPELRPDFTIDTLWTDTNRVFDAVAAGGWGYKGDTIEALATAAQIEPATLRATFDQYQDYCKNGQDLYFNKESKYMVGYDYGPYYLVESWYNQLGTVTGLVVNSKLQVVDAKHSPIPGLYSCGADASSTLYNNMYTGQGDCLGWAITSGKVAGESAAAYNKGR